MECCEGKGKRLNLWNCEDKVTLAEALRWNQELAGRFHFSDSPRNVPKGNAENYDS